LGLHLTTDPSKWVFENCSIYEAEPKTILGKRDDKIVTKSARLIRKLSNVECVNFGVIKEKFKKTIFLNEKFNNNIYIKNANANIIFGENFKCQNIWINVFGSKLSIINLSNSKILITAENSNIMLHSDSASRFNKINSINCAITSIGKNYIYAYKKSVIKAFAQTNVVIDSSFDGKIYSNIPKSKITSRYFNLKRKDLPFTIVNI
jgi:hypothetical protein